uniref:NADH dehydrogenase subunit 2 n=1 Tax=Batracomorphus extentus TaxID=1962543 RepID=UPI00257E562A|nr:NADH dehydrogenase subunit 2 [Batracomorphus extentus]WHE42612.1 NADH dehydrogenase subunit 2 [Batracomorphus extentus]
MWINSTKMLFISTMSMSIVLSISSSSMIIIWMSIEISNMSFTPIMMTKKMNNSESIMKFFMIQSMSSMIMLFALMMLMLNNNNYDYMLMMSLVMKMGGVPFHNWVIAIIKGMEYNSMMMLFTIMKIPTMSMLSMINIKMNLMVIMAMMLSTMMMVNENSMKKMLALSSMFNLVMMLMLSKNINMWILFLMIYSIIMKMMMEQLKNNKIKQMNQLMVDSKKISKKEIWLSMMSLGGMPPLMGFINKLMVINAMMKNKEIIMMMMLVLTSSTILYVYMKYTFSCMMFQLSMNKTNMKMFFVKKYSYIPINMIMTPMFLSMKTFI